MPAIPGAIAAVRSLIGMGYEVWMATKPPTGVAYAYSDKAQWVMDNIPELKRRIIITHDKGLLGAPGDYLIDDRPHKANCERFLGTLIRFTDGVTWSDVLDRLRKDSRSSTSVVAASANYAVVLHPETEALVDRFAVAMKAKLLAAQNKYGYTDGWKRKDWMEECRDKLIEHVQKGDPCDVAAYAMFLWHHEERTALRTTLSIPSVHDIYSRLRSVWATSDVPEYDMKARAFDTHSDVSVLLDQGAFTSHAEQPIQQPEQPAVSHADRIAAAAADSLNARPELIGCMLPLARLGHPDCYVIYGKVHSVRMHAEVLPDPETHSVKDYSGTSLARRVMRNLFNRDQATKPRWAVVSDNFGLGSNYSAELCRIYGLDPDEQMSGIECKECISRMEDEEEEDEKLEDFSVVLHRRPEGIG